MTIAPVPTETPDICIVPLPAPISPYQLIPLDEHEGMFVGNAATMRDISHQIENVILEDQLPVVMYAGFQRFSNFLREQERYEALARTCEHIYVWGIPDVPPPAIANITFVPVHEAEDLAREWFIVVDSPGFFTSLIAQEYASLPDGSRQFKGVWTHDPDLVTQSMLLITRMLDTFYLPSLERDLVAQGRFVTRMFSRLMGRLVEHVETATAPLQHNLNMMRAALGESNEPLLLVDAQKKIIAATPQACAALAVPMDDVVGAPLAEVCGGAFTQRDPTTVTAPMMSLLQMTDDRLLAASSKPIAGTDGAPMGWVITLHMSNQQRRRYRRHTLPIASSLLPYATALDEQLAQIAALCAVTESEPAQQALAQAQQTLNAARVHMQRLDLLHRLEAQGEVSTRQWDAEELLRRMTQEHYITLRRHRIILRGDIQATLDTIPCDAEQVRLAVRELIDNVLTHAHGTRSVAVYLGNDGPFVTLSIRDEGPGISEAEQQAILTSFVHPERRGCENRLGLIIARAVARAHHGHLHIDSTPGQGTTVTLLLPLDRE